MRSRFFRLTWLNVLSNVTVPLVGLVDTAMLGHLPDIRFLAGVALASLVFDYVYWTFGFLRMGTTGTTAQAVGKGDARECGLILYRALTLAVLVSAVVLALQVPIRELGFTLLSGEAGVEAAGRAYFDARIWGAPAALCNFALIGWFLGREESGRVLVVTVIGNVANVALDYLFIMHLGWESWGAGLATAIAQYGMLLTAVALFLTGSGRVAWRWSDVLAREPLVALVKLNRDILIRTLCLITSFAVFVNLSALHGAAVLAATSIQLHLLSLAAYFIDGAAFATESLAGIFHGRGDRASLRRLVRLALVTGEVMALAVLGALAIAPRFLFGLLTHHVHVVDLALDTALWLAPTLLFSSIAYIYDGLFIGLTAGRAMRNSMLASLLVFLGGASAGYALHDVHVLWASMVAFMVTRVVTLGWASRRLVSR